MSKAPKYKKAIVPLPGGSVDIYAAPKHSAALESLGDMRVYEGVQILSLMEAIYKQGKKDGAREVFTTLDAQIETVKGEIPHKNPGQPKKKKKKK